MTILTVFLYPFAIIYDFVTRFRNFLFEKNFYKQVRFDLATISVGNLSVGGTGKTPTIEFLIDLFKDDYQIATLSRGYGRKTKGFLMADEDSDSTDIGDEPLQFYTKYGKDVAVCVGEERVFAIPALVTERPGVNLVLLDDAYQHRYVRRDCNVLLTSYSNLFYDDYVLPAGRLRESRLGANRADVVLVSKCPKGLSLSDQKAIIKNIKKYNSKAEVFFSYIGYNTIRSLSGKVESFENVITLTGIANANTFIDEVKSTYKVVDQLEYSDHYNYKNSDVEKLIGLLEKNADKNPVILTTEKDAMRLKSLNLPTELNNRIYYWPIAFKLINHSKDEFKQVVASKLSK